MGSSTQGNNEGATLAAEELVEELTEYIEEVQEYVDEKVTPLLDASGDGETP